MIPSQTFETYAPFGDNATKAQPDVAKYAAGFQQADVLPAEWLNWAWNKNTVGITDLNKGLKSVEDEIIAVLTAASITPAEATPGQLKSAIDIIIQSKTGVLSSLATTAKDNLVAALNEIKNGLGTASAKTVGTAAGNVPEVGTALGSTNNNIVVTDASGKLKPSGTVIGSAAGKTAGSAAGNVPLVGTALGTTNNNIVVTDASGGLKPSGTTIGSAAGKTAGSAEGNVPLINSSAGLGTTDGNIVTTDSSGNLKASGTTIGSAAGKTAGSAKGNVPLINSSAGLGTTDGNIVVTDASGNLKASGKKVGSAAGNVPEIGTALGTTNNNIVVTDASGKLKPSGTTIGSAAGKTAGSAVGNVPLVGTALGTTDNTIALINSSGALKPNADTDTNTIANLKTYIKNQNILSNFETITISTNSASPTIMSYDGFLTLNWAKASGESEKSERFYINGIEINWLLASTQPRGSNTLTLSVKKGDTVYLSSSVYISTSIVRYFKSRDYSGR